MSADSPLRKTFLRLLTQDGPTKDRRRRDFNQAIFNAEKGWAVFNGTDLNMVMEKFDKAVRLAATPPVPASLVGADRLRYALIAIRDMEPEPTTLPEHKDCAECRDISERVKRGMWHISGMCDERYLQLSARDRNADSNYRAQVYRMRDIARAALAASEPPTPEPESEPCPFCSLPSQTKGAGCMECRGRGTVGLAFRRNRGLPPLSAPPVESVDTGLLDTELFDAIRKAGAYLDATTCKKVVRLLATRSEATPTPEDET